MLTDDNAPESHGDPRPHREAADAATPRVGRSWLPVLLIGVALLALYTFVRPHAGSTAMRAAAERPIMTTFVARDLDGKAWSLADQKGKVVLINYWATWCGPCRQELPELARTARHFSGPDFAVVGINLDEGAGDLVRKTVAEAELPYPNLTPPPGSDIAAGIEAIPTTLLIDRQGRIAKRYMGAVSESMLKGDIETLIKERG